MGVGMGVAHQLLDYAVLASQDPEWNPKVLAYCQRKVGMWDHMFSNWRRYRAISV